MTTGSAVRPRVPTRRVRAWTPGWTVTALAAACAAAAIATAARPDHPELVVAARAIIVGVPFAVGLYAWQQGTNRRFGLSLVVVGAFCLLATLADSSNPVAYTVGRSAGWVVEALLVYVVLSYPGGRLTSRRDRLVVAAMWVTVAVFFLPRVWLAEDFDVPSPYTSCLADCPSNVAFALESEPGIVDAVMRPAGVLCVFAVGIAVLWSLRARRREATPLARRMFTLVLVIGAARELAVGIGLAARLADSSGLALEVASWCIALAVPALALAFLLGILRWRLFAGSALQRLADCLRSAPDAHALRRGFAEAFGDPSIEIAFPVSDVADRWVSPSGEPVQLTSNDDARAVSEVQDGGAVVAAIVHDPALRMTPGLVDAGLAMAAVALENQRLTAEARAATREVERSRARIAASADRERRRIERDLHDGAQQRLVALRVELELAEDLIRQDAQLGIGRIHELEGEVDEALDELRSLAHGVYPSLLADRGLPEAVGAAAIRCPVATQVASRDVGRYTPEVESAVYFCVLEALQNVAKHARDARRATVELDGLAGGAVRFVVSDDGRGIEHAPAHGDGLTNMRDRLEAVAGTLTVTSPAGGGVTVAGEIPAPGRGE